MLPKPKIAIVFIKYNKGKDNGVVNLLSHKHTFLTELDTKLMGFDYIKGIYATNPNFSSVF